MAHFEVYSDARRQYRWRLKANNGRIVADSAESYLNKQDCESMIEWIKKHAPSVQVVDLVR